MNNERKKAIEYLDTLEVVNYITVNIPIFGNDRIGNNINQLISG